MCDDNICFELRCCVINNDTKGLDKLLSGQNNSSLLNSNYKNETLLHWSAKNNNPDCVRLLLSMGADRNRLDAHGLTALELAKTLGSHYCVRLLELPPPPVLDIRIVSYGTTFIHLEWSDPTLKPFPTLDSYAPISSYHVECTSPRSCSSSLHTSSSHSLELSDLLPAHEYHFRVWCESSAGFSAISPTLCFITAPEVPSAVPPVDLLKITTNGLLLAWLEPELINGSAVDGYEIEIQLCSDMSGNEWSRCFRHRSLERSRLLVGLQRGKPYRCRVRSHNAVGWSAWSERSQEYTPGECVKVAKGIDDKDDNDDVDDKIKREEGVILSWFVPVLSGGRAVQKYKVEYSIVTGPLTKVHSSRLEDALMLDTATSDFIRLGETCQDTFILKSSEYKKPCKCVFRIAVKIDGRWSDESSSLVSEITAL